jgi:hypothetical protein
MTRLLLVDSEFCSSLVREGVFIDLLQLAKMEPHDEAIFANVHSQHYKPISNLLKVISTSYRTLVYTHTGSHNSMLQAHLGLLIELQELIEDHNVLDQVILFANSHYIEFVKLCLKRNLNVRWITDYPYDYPYDFGDNANLTKVSTTEYKLPVRQPRVRKDNTCQIN